MARWATLIEVAGNSFTGCRGEIVDGQGFLSAYAGSVDWANDAKPHTQVFNRGVKGIPFGIQMVSSEQTLLLATIDDVRTAQAANATFRVKLNDSIYTIDVQAVPDYSAGWITHGKHSEGWVENVLMRFISTGPGA